MYVLEEGDSIPYAKLRFEFDSFRARLGSIYTIKGVNTPRILEMISDVPKSEMYKTLEMLSDDLNSKLQSAAAKHLKTLKLIPLPKKYLP